MRIAFYAPLKSPEHAIPSGDRRVGRLLMDALRIAGHRVDLASGFRSHEPAGDPLRQVELRASGHAIAQELFSDWQTGPAEARPDLWFTYHVYYKAPDWLGPRVSAALGIPYVIAEASHAPKRAGGPWALGHEAATAAIRSADAVFCPTRDDMACVEAAAFARDRVRFLPPFVDHVPYAKAAVERDAHRGRLAQEFGIDPAVPWIVVAAMMRPGDKLASYRMLATVLHPLQEIAWRLIVVGDGAARSEVQGLLESTLRGRAHFLGERNADELTDIFAAGDLNIWPAVNEAYGMAMLEAQAAGSPVIARKVRGVPDVVCDGKTGLLAAHEGNPTMTELTRRLLLDHAYRLELGRAAAAFVAAERSIESAAACLGQVLSGLSIRSKREIARASAP